MKQFISFLVFLASFFEISAQNFDSLRKLIHHKNTIDSVRVFAMIDLAVQLRNIKPDSSLFLATQAYNLSEKLNFLKGQGRATRTQGIYYQNKKVDLQTALHKYHLALKISQKAKDLQGEGDAYASIGGIYRLRGDYGTSLKNYFHALEIYEKIGSTKTSLFASINANIGTIYQSQQIYEQAMYYFKISLNINKEIRNKEGMAGTYKSMGKIYQAEGKMQEAFQMEWACLAIQKKLSGHVLLAFTQADLAHLHLLNKQLDSAKYYAFTSIKDAELSQAPDVMTYSKTMLAAYHNASKDHANADLNAKEAQILAKKLGITEYLLLASKERHIACKKLGKIAEALQNYELYVQLKDSLQSEKNTKKSLGAEFQYKEEKTKIEQEKKDLEQKANEEYQKRIAYSLAGITFTLIVVSALIYKNNQQKQKANQALNKQQDLIEQQNEELKQNYEEVSLALETLAEQKREIQEKNKNIMDSLNVGNRIQSAMFPSQEQMNLGLGKGNFFVFFKPRDIVSGDFYFFEDVGKKLICIVADCTGHGIPGAFVGMIGYQILGEIILKEDIHQPDQILNKLHLEISRSLRQDENNSKEGMDMAIVTLTKNKTNPLKFDKMEFAGAMNPLYYVQNNEFFEIKGTKLPIGGKNTNHSRPFEKHEIIISEQGLIFYLCSDGFQDQFGGEKAKKFMTKKLRETLFEISNQNPEQQEQTLDSIFKNWKGIEKQIDDVSILGIRIL